MFFNYPPEEYLGAKLMNPRKAISPILATVIIIAVTLVIAIGVIGWIMGIWGTFGSTESLQIYPDSYIKVNSTGSYLELHVKNAGTATAVINKIEIVGKATNTSGFSTSSVGPGVEAWIELKIGSSNSYTAGTSYQVKVYTAAGNVYSAVVQAKSS